MSPKPRLIPQDHQPIQPQLLDYQQLQVVAQLDKRLEQLSQQLSLSYLLTRQLSKQLQQLLSQNPESE